MRGFAIGAFLLVVVAAFCFILYIVFNFVLYNPDSGIDTILNEKATDMMNENNLAKWTTSRSNLATGFAMSGVICLFLAILLFVLGALRSTRIKT